MNVISNQRDSAVAPVIIFVYKRKEHIKKTIEALRDCSLATKTDVFIYSDGARNEKDIKEVQKVREYIQDIAKQGGFANVFIRMAETNKGLGASIIDGVSEIIEQRGKAIILEDDIIVRREFLIFMNNALEYYSDKKNVWAISGYTVPVDVQSKQNKYIYATCRANCWGWASWKDRWEMIDWEVEDYKKFVFNRSERKEFNRGGADLSRMLDAYMVGAIDSWAIRWNYAQYKNNMIAIVPRMSLCRNLGLDGSGENCGIQKTDIMSGKEYQDTSEFLRVELREVDIEEQIQNQLKQYYDYMYPLGVRIKKSIKSFVRRIKWWVRIGRKK